MAIAVFVYLVQQSSVISMVAYVLELKHPLGNFQYRKAKEEKLENHSNFMVNRNQFRIRCIAGKLFHAVPEPAGRVNADCTILYY